MMKAATIFLLLFLASCTVTKRVHRPGYHIEWKKNYRVQKISKPEQEVRFSSKELPLETSELEAKNLDLEISNDNALEPLLNVPEASTNHISVADNVQETSSNSNRALRVKSRKYAPFEKFSGRKKSRSKANGSGSTGLQYFGYMLLGISAFLLFGCFFAYFGLWALESLFYSLVFSGSGLIAGILGFILFLIILLIVFIAYAIVEYLLGSYIIGLIVAGIAALVGALCLLIANNV